MDGVVVAKQLVAFWIKNHSDGESSRKIETLPANTDSRFEIGVTFDSLHTSHLFNHRAT